MNELRVKLTDEWIMRNLGVPLYFIDEDNYVPLEFSWNHPEVKIQRSISILAPYYTPAGGRTRYAPNLRFHIKVLDSGFDFVRWRVWIVYKVIVSNSEKIVYNPTIVPRKRIRY